MKTVARLSNFGIPPLKARRFAGTIKGKPVDNALAILDLQGSPACQMLHKLLKSAIANAENNNGLDPQNLQVSNVIVDNGPTMKRIRPRARGRAYQILKRSCHVTIELDLRDEIKRKQQAASKTAAAPEAAAKPAAAKKTATTAKAKPAAGAK